MFAACKVIACPSSLYLARGFKTSPAPSDQLIWLNHTFTAADVHPLDFFRLAQNLDVTTWEHLSLTVLSLSTASPFDGARTTPSPTTVISESAAPATRGTNQRAKFLGIRARSVLNSFPKCKLCSITTFKLTPSRTRQLRLSHLT